MMKKKRNFFKKGQYKPAKIDPDDPYVKEVMAGAKRAQEENERLKRINPKIGDLFVG